MKNRFVRVTVVTIVVSLFYFMLFTEKVKDKSHENYPSANDIANIQEIDTLLNQKGYLVIGKLNDVKLISIKDSVKFKDYVIVGTYNNEAIIARVEDKNSLEVYKKFPLEQYFNKYKVEVYQGILADPDFTSNPDAKMFITRITEACKELGINFAGRYTLVYWGCGTSCQYGVLVDRITGQIFDGYQTSLGSEFRKDSKFIIMDSDILEGNTEYIPLYQLQKFRSQVWNGKEFVSVN